VSAGEDFDSHFEANMTKILGSDEIEVALE